LSGLRCAKQKKKIVKKSKSKQKENFSNSINSMIAERAFDL